MKNAQQSPSSPAAACPFHSASAVQPPTKTLSTTAWPPGPRGLKGGWWLLRQMRRDLLSCVARWQAEFGDLVHLRIWPEHQVVVMNPELARELLVANHDALVRWERGVSVFAKLQAGSVLVAEGEAWRSKRHALVPGFSPKSVNAFTPSIASAAARSFAVWPAVVAEWADWGIEEAFTSLTMDVIMRMLFSSDIGDDARRAEQAAHTALLEANAAFYWPARSANNATRAPRSTPSSRSTFTPVWRCPTPRGQKIY
jgi:cytochrome P450